MKEAIGGAMATDWPDTVMEQERLRRAIEEKRKAEAQGEEASKRALAAKYRRDGLPKDLREQLASGKIPPMPGDELPMGEWMKLRGGTDAENAKARQQQAGALRALAAQQNAAASSLPYLTYGNSLGNIYDAGSDAPKRPARKPKAPEKTTEEAQRELTETGRRKIIVDEEDNNA